MKFARRPLGDAADASRPRLRWRDITQTAAALTLVVALLWLAVTVFANVLAAYLPDSVEAKVFASLNEDLGADADTKAPAQQIRAERLFARLLEAGKESGLVRRELPYHLVVLNMDEPNAFAAAGGMVGITRGLLTLVASNGGVAFVLAHELAHHEKRHVLKGLWRQLGWQALLALGGLDYAAKAAAFGELGYSRAMEEEADQAGLELARAAFGERDDYGAFFAEFLAMQEGDAPPGWLAWLSTHPNTAERLQNLRRWQSEQRQ